jgi:hypothetical protein
MAIGGAAEAIELINVELGVGDHGAGVEWFGD